MLDAGEVCCDRRANPLIAAVKAEVGLKTCICAAHLLDREQHIAALLHQERPPFLAELDGSRERDVARFEIQLATALERRTRPAGRIKVEAECLGQLSLRDP